MWFVFPDGRVQVFLNRGFKRVRLTKKTPCPPVYGNFQGSIQPIPGRNLHVPVKDGDPGDGRRVARIIHEVSSPGDRFDVSRKQCLPCMCNWWLDFCGHGFLLHCPVRCVVRLL